jgi:hypothetical protein
VLGCLVARRGPVRLPGLNTGWLPGASRDGGFPGCGSCRRGGPGSRLGWPCRLLRGGVVPIRAAPLGRGCVPARPSLLPARRGREPGLDPPDPGLQAGPLRTQVALREPHLVLARAGDRPRPPRRGFPGQSALAPLPGRRTAHGVQLALRAPGRQVPARQRPQMRPDCPQHRLICRRHPKPCPHPRSRRGSRHERDRDLPQPATPGIPRRQASHLHTASVLRQTCSCPQEHAEQDNSYNPGLTRCAS